MKVCRSCGRRLELAQFSRKRGVCRECRAEVERERRRRERLEKEEAFERERRDTKPDWLQRLQARAKEKMTPMATNGKTTKQRGYGQRHKELRARYGRLVAIGDAYCSRCSLPIYPGELWDLDHLDDRSGYAGPAHRTCNRRAGQAASMASRGTPMPAPQRYSRDW